MKTLIVSIVVACLVLSGPAYAQTYLESMKAAKEGSAKMRAWAKQLEKSEEAERRRHAKTANGRWEAEQNAKYEREHQGLTESELAEQAKLYEHHYEEGYR